MNTQFEQETFSYYKEGVLTWIHLNETGENEAETASFPWQERTCRFIRDLRTLDVVQEGGQEQHKEGAWMAAVDEKSYGYAEAGYWDTG